MKALIPAAVAAGLFLAPAVLSQDSSKPKTDKPKTEQVDKDKDKAGKDKMKTFAVGQEVDGGIALTDITGKQHQLSAYRGKIVVIDFWSIDCPVSQAYEKRLMRLHEKYAPKGIVFLALDANTTELDRTTDKPYGRIKAYVDTNKIPYPVLVDDHNWIADRFDAKTTPHAFILDAKGVLRYAGAIDDDPKGEMGEKATNHVAAALDALLAGGEVKVSSTKPVGCSIKRVTPEEQKAYKQAKKAMKDKEKGETQG